MTTLYTLGILVITAALCVGVARALHVVAGRGFAKVRMPGGSVYSIYVTEHSKGWVTIGSVCDVSDTVTLIRVRIPVRL